MSDEVIDPKENPELAAQQLVIELIRAGKTMNIAGLHTKPTVEAILYTHQALCSHFKKLKDN